MAAVRHVASIEYGRVVASVIGTVHDWTLAEDAVQDALARAVERWPGDGVPANPAAWVTTVARRRAIDLVRHADAERRAVARLEHEPPPGGVDNTPETDDHEDAFPHGDERLKLIFTACHPALTLEARAALTLRTVLNVSIEQLAGIFAVAPATMEKRLVRARAKIAHANIPYRVPDAAQLDSRSASVCEVLSALFTIGYSDPTLQPDPGAEAIRLARLCRQLLPADSPARLEFTGLLALLLLQHSRRAARTTPDGLSVPFDEQDRELWDVSEIEEGLRLLDDAVEEAARAGIHGGRHLIRATVAAEYVRPDPGMEIDHARIADIYGVLEQVDASPFVRLNRAVAVANAGRPAEALALMEALESSLGGHHLYSAVRGDLLQRLRRVEEARSAFRDAARAAPTERERRSYSQHADDIASAST
ncbi:RNA polymerase sigma-70 factor, ECF subfamily [Microbacterium paraoxydans]|uniref:RNA polymerase sigma-70 factor, ECF subfamily n=2 Tax=Microbacterium paraoxydans TaxID=199592 RepID=A0A1H1TLG5_9MICO|nr:RNA polymerase sigma-70 factor, ECF subfamily [Microbacterium paraoxydans]